MSRACLCAQDTGRLIAATGASQIEFLEALTATDGIEWSRVRVGIGRYHLLDGDADPGQVAQQAGDVLAARRPDLAFVGIGENGCHTG